MINDEISKIARNLDIGSSREIDSIISEIEEYLRIMYKWGSSINLFSRNLPVKRLIDEHISDALCAGQIIRHYPRVCDIGSGNGMPGIIYAILNRQIALTLCDTDQKKCAFLTTIVSRLNLSNVRIENGDFRSLDIQDYDLISSKAFMSIGGLISELPNYEGDYLFYAQNKNDDLADDNVLKNMFASNYQLHTFANTIYNEHQLLLLKRLP